MTESEVERHDQHTNPTKEKHSRLVSTILHSVGALIDNVPPDVILQKNLTRGLGRRERSEISISLTKAGALPLDQKPRCRIPTS